MARAPGDVANHLTVTASDLIDEIHRQVRTANRVGRTPALVSMNELHADLAAAVAELRSVETEVKKEAAC